MAEKKLNYGYYSRVLNRPFDTLEELRKAEEEYKKAQAEELRKAEEQKARAEEVQNAYALLQETRKEAQRYLENAEASAQEMIKRAENNYKELCDKYNKDYCDRHSATEGRQGKMSLEDVLQILRQL